MYFHSLPVVFLLHRITHYYWKAKPCSVTPDMQPGVGLLHMTALTLVFSLDWKYCRKKQSVPWVFLLLSFKSPESVFSSVASGKWAFFLLSKLTIFQLPPTWELLLSSCFCVVLAVPSFPLLQRSGYCLCQLFLEVLFVFCSHPGCNKACSPLLASLPSGTTASLSAHILDGTSSVLFLAPPQGGTSGTFCIWRNGQRHSASGLYLPFFLLFFSCIEKMCTESRKKKKKNLCVDLTVFWELY